MTDEWWTLLPWWSYAVVLLISVGALRLGRLYWMLSASIWLFRHRRSNRVCAALARLENRIALLGQVDAHGHLAAGAQQKWAHLSPVLEAAPELAMAEAWQMLCQAVGIDSPHPQVSAVLPRIEWLVREGRLDPLCLGLVEELAMFDMLAVRLRPDRPSAERYTKLACQTAALIAAAQYD